MSQIRINVENAVIEHLPDGTVAVKRRGKGAVVGTTGDGETTVRVTDRVVTIIQPDAGPEPVEDAAPDAEEDAP